MATQDYITSESFLRDLIGRAPDESYRPLRDVELIELVRQPSTRERAQTELLRRHAAMLVMIIRRVRSSKGGAEYGDYEGLAMIYALEVFDTFDVSKNVQVNTWLHQQVTRRLIDAKRRTSLETDHRWPEKKLAICEWIVGTYDNHPEVKAEFERIHGLTADDLPALRERYKHLIYYGGDTSGRTSPVCNASMVRDYGVPDEDVILDRMMLNDALKALESDVDRSIVHMLMFEDMCIRDIASRLELPVHVIHRRIRRFRQSLATVLV